MACVWRWSADGGDLIGSCIGAGGAGVLGANGVVRGCIEVWIRPGAAEAAEELCMNRLRSASALPPACWPSSWENHGDCRSCMIDAGVCDRLELSGPPD